jgi:hypothetical protein
LVLQVELLLEQLLEEQRLGVLGQPAHQEALGAVFEQGLHGEPARDAALVLGAHVDAEQLLDVLARNAQVPRPGDGAIPPLDGHHLLADAAARDPPHDIDVFLEQRG